VYITTALYLIHKVNAIPNTVHWLWQFPNWRTAFHWRETKGDWVAHGVSKPNFINDQRQRLLNVCIYCQCEHDF